MIVLEGRNLVEKAVARVTLFNELILIDPLCPSDRQLDEYGEPGEALSEILKPDQSIC